MKRHFFILLLAAAILKGNAQIPVNLPEILVSQMGLKISNTQQWEQIRRPEIMELFLNKVYGKIPSEFDPEIKFTINETDSSALQGKAIRKQVSIQIANPHNDKKIDATLLIYLPANIGLAVPVFLGLNFDGNHTIHPDPAILISKNWVRNNEEKQIEGNIADSRSRGIAISRWPVEYILSRGYGIATMFCGDIDPDYDDGFNNGLHSLFPSRKTDYPGNLAGTITAWAYGLSKALDYLETDPDVIHDRVIVIGHSRLGKAALWAGASDERFAMIISNNSGCGGAALSMRKHGETVEKINDRFPHWFCGNFKKFNGMEEELAVDQHMLLALIAPRPSYVASAQEDDWADPYGEQLSAWLASDVYSLYGLKVKVPNEPAIINCPIKEGFVGYHIRSGKHDINGYDWEQYIDFADYHFNTKMKLD